MILSKNTKSQVGCFTGVILISHGFKDVTRGVWFGSMVIDQLSVGIDTFLISPSNIVFCVLEIFNCMLI